jgi:glutathione synthase
MSASKHRLGVVMDPIESITPAKDSTLAMMLAAQRQGMELVYLTQAGLSITDGQAEGQGFRVSVKDDPQEWFELLEPWQAPLAELDALLMRKDPPFDTEYIHTTYILELAGHAGLLVINHPASLRNLNEKASTAWFPQCTPPSLLTRSEDQIKAFLQTHGRIVVKPLDGMGGKSIFVISQDEMNTNVILETMTNYGARYTLAQRFIPEIRDGDKRILVVDGEIIPYALARIPAADDIRGNLVLGAKGEGRPLTKRDRWIAEQVVPTLKEQGVLFAGLDVIGDYLTEINVTSPTGIRELDRQFDLDIAAKLIKAIETRLNS